MNTNKEYIKAMNQLDEKLKPENQKYFANLREYVNTFKFKKDESVIQQQLYQMYLDFLDAQEDGLTAKEFFGNNPKEMADHLLEEMPGATFKTLLKYAGILATILWSIRLFFDFSENLIVVINPVLYLFDLALIISLTLIIFKLIQKSIYRKTTLEDINKIEAMILIFILLIYILLYFNANEYIPDILTFAVSYPWDIVLILIFFIGAEFLFYKLNITNFYSLAITLIMLLLIGLETRLVIHTGFRIPFLYRIIILISLFIINWFIRKKDLY